MNCERSQCANRIHEGKFMTKSAAKQQFNSVEELVQFRQQELGLTDEELAGKVGYKPPVVSMIKKGAMRVPLNKVVELAAALLVDPFEVYRLVLTAQSPDLWSAIQQLAPVGTLSQTEVSLIRHVREISGDREVAPIVFSGGVVALVAVQ